MKRKKQRNKEKRNEIKEAQKEIINNGEEK